MKIGLVNFSGNVGKSTLAVQLFKPRMRDAKIFSVESLNIGASRDGVEVEQMKGKQFGELQKQLMTLEDSIVDVGSSNVEEFLKRMIQFEGSHEEFDFFVVPVVPDQKQQGDTVNTIRSLAKIGVPKEKIRMVFNMVDVDDSVEDDFAPLFGLAKAEKSFVINPKAVVYKNEVFALLTTARKTMGDLLDDDTNYRELLKTEQDEKKREILVTYITLQRLAKTANRNMDQVFNTLFS